MNYYEIRDRVPCSEIDALTVEAARVWLERNGWTIREEWTHHDGVTTMRTYGHGGHEYALPDHNRFLDQSIRMAQVIQAGCFVSGKRAHVVIAEIRAIAEWQKRCKEWVPFKDGEMCNHCWACDAALASPWEAPGSSFPFMPSCPTCGNKRCPRATDHRNECSGSNEAGQEGSRFA